MDNRAYTHDSLDVPDRVRKYRVTETEGGSPEDSNSFSNSSRSILAQFLATFINSLSAVSLGMLYMISAVVVESVYNAKNGLSLNDEQVSWYASLVPIVQPFGCFLGGYLQKYIGRKHGIALMNAATIVSWILLYVASNAEMLYLSSMMMGMSIGLTEAPIITYVAEITTPSLRGMFVAYTVCNCTAGIALIFFLSLFMFWRTLCIFSVCLCVLSILLLLFIPDSPTWLINKGKEEEALKALRWLRGWVSEEQVEQEFESLSQHIKSRNEQPSSDSDGKISWKHKLGVNELLEASALRPFFLATIFYFFACAAMVAGGRSYFLVLFASMHVPIDPTWLALLCWIASVFGNIACCFLVKKFGKRSISLLSMFFAASICILIGLYIAFQHKLNQPWIFAILMVGLGFAHYLGISPVPWIILGEIYPVKVRSLATGITGAIFYVTIFIYVKTYHYLDLLLTTQGIFFLYGILGFIGFFFLLKFMPETEGKTAAEIEELFVDNSRNTCSHFRKMK